MKGRLVAVSNRVGPVKAAASAGGLAVALVEALRRSHGLWFGWSGAQVASGKEQLHVREEGGLTLATLDLPHEIFEAYYNSFSNACLWPLFHFRLDLMRYEPRALAAYREVNHRFADKLQPLLKRDDAVWVHDFHLCPLAAELRALGAQQPMGFFLHTPFPPRDVMNTLPVHEWIVQSLFSYDLAGFQSAPDLQRFTDYVEREAGGRVEGNIATAYGRKLRVGVFPVGIDVESFRKLATSKPAQREVEKLRGMLHGRDQIIGVDRLDYSKGLLRRLGAYEDLLDRHAELHGKVEFLQVAPISRGELPAYRSFRAELERDAARINGRFARVDWTPVRYLSRPLPRRTLASLYRASRVGLVTPVRDGMNLVAKEYVAAQDPEDPGVLVLSRFTGAAQQMDAAVLINPYDACATADAMHLALRMSREERRQRHASLMAGLESQDIGRWREDYLRALAAAAAEIPGLEAEQEALAEAAE